MNDHTTNESTIKLCECGCGESVPQAKFPSWQRKYISGHHPTAIRPLADRFWEKVDKRGTNDCWEWQGALDRKGYGEIKAGRSRKIVRAHRLAWILEHGECPNDLLVCHQCDNPKCCNPHHLFLGTFQDNLADMRKKGRHAYGEKHGWAKLSDKQVEELREKFATGQYTLAQLSKEYGIQSHHVSRIINRTRRALA